MQFWKVFHVLLAIIALEIQTITTLHLLNKLLDIINAYVDIFNMDLIGAECETVHNVENQ